MLECCLYNIKKIDFSQIFKKIQFMEPLDRLLLLAYIKSLTTDAMFPPIKNNKYNYFFLEGKKINCE